MKVDCAVCGEPLDFPLEKHYAGVFGWEKPGRGTTGNSGSSLILRKRTGALAHAGCILKIQHGIVPEQMTFGDVL